MKKNVLVISGADFSQHAVEQISFVSPLPALNEWVSGLGNITMSNGASLDQYSALEGFVYDSNTVIRGIYTGGFFSQRNIRKICIYNQTATATLIVGKQNKTTGVLTQLASISVPNYTTSRITSIGDGKNIINCDIYIPEDSYLYVRFMGTGTTIIADNGNNTQYSPCYTKLHGGSKIQTDGTLAIRANTSPLVDFYI